MKTYLTKWALKLPKIWIIVENEGGGSDEKYPKIRNKTAETPKNLPKR